MSSGDRLATDIPRRWWLQYSLRTLFLATAVVAMVLSFLTWRHKRRREAVHAATSVLVELGAAVGLHQNGADFDDMWPLESPEVSIASADFRGSAIRDSDLEKLCALTNLEGLGLSNTNITDAGIAHLEKMKQLRGIFLDGTRVTSAGVARLQASLPGCQIIMTPRAAPLRNQRAGEATSE